MLFIELLKLLKIELYFDVIYVYVDTQRGEEQ